MTHVAQGSSSNGSSMVGNKPVVFDISTESGLLTVLRAIHRSPVEQSIKNHLRDVVFDFTKDNVDSQIATLKALNEAGFIASFADLSVEKIISKNTQPTLGRVRITPQFAPVAVVAKTVTAPTPSVAPTVPSKPVSAPVPPVAATHEVTPATPMPAPVIEPQPVSVAMSTEPNPTHEMVETVPEAAPVPAASASIDPMERIKEIKHRINEKVGNPITLIDMDNHIGRQYMNSLLSAMKVVNGGRPDEVATAMAKLEKAFSEAMSLVEKVKAGDLALKETQASAPLPKVNVPPSAAPVVKSPVVVPVAEETAPAAADAMGTPVKINVLSHAATAHTTPAVGQSVVLPSEEQEAQSAAVPITIENRTVAAEESLVRMADEKTVSISTPPDTHATSTRLMSVAKEEQLQNLLRQKQIEQVQSAEAANNPEPVSVDPLNAPEVTAGLKQLLSEWSLFKGSGFFGTGPGGADHPLYKKVSMLTMAAVIAGRFEGASPQVKQSITDYMNGWRYEEGIVHEHSETFEHYLRRVIRHILDKKAKK